MAERKEYGFSEVVLTLFVCLAPIIGSGADKRAVIYTSLFVSLIAIVNMWHKKGAIYVTKTAIFCFACAAMSFLWLIWVTDKGGQFALGSTFLMAGTMNMLLAEYKTHFTEEKISEKLIRTIYISAFLYAVSAVFWQIFIKSDFWGSNMDMGQGSPSFAAMFMLMGIGAALKIFGKDKKNIGVLIAAALMAYVLIMAKSLVGYFAVAIFVFFKIVNEKHKRVEAFSAMIAALVLGVVNIIYLIVTIVSGSLKFDGAFRGITAIIGVGCGGYNASSEIVGRAYKAYPPVFSILTEAFGILGLLITAVFVMSAVKLYLKERSEERLVILLAVIVLCLTSSSALLIALPLFAMYFSLKENAYELKIDSLVSFTLLLPIVFFGFLACARLPYAIGKNALDTGKYESATKWYSYGASMEIFNSDGWENAYHAAHKAYEDAEIYTTPLQREYLEKAIKFNKKNYEYKRLLANVYTLDKNYEKALEIWEGIIQRYDREVLYEEYALKIYAVMENCHITLEEMEGLYNTLDEYGKKCVDKDVKYKVNNILAKSQQYYIQAREGASTAADMYITGEDDRYITEDAT